MDVHILFTFNTTQEAQQVHRKLDEAGYTPRIMAQYSVGCGFREEDVRGQTPEGAATSREEILGDWLGGMIEALCGKGGP